jgi:hypothetical protein
MNQEPGGQTFLSVPNEVFLSVPKETDKNACPPVV